jgi:hypothetical protein
LTLGLKCGESPDDACQAKIGDHVHADRYIWGSVRSSPICTCGDVDSLPLARCSRTAINSPHRVTKH